MGAVSLPFNFQNGDPLDADPVMANSQAIVAAVNGGLEMGSNVKAAAPSASITGKDLSAGVSTSGLRADAQFVLQGVENVTAKPTTGNFLGRLCYVTAGGDIGKLFLCTDAVAPTFVAIGNQGASDVAVHAAQHKDGGHDPLADNTLTDHMFAAKTNIFKATLASDHTGISTSAYSNIVDLTTVTTTGQQTLHVIVTVRTVNTGSNKPNIAFRVQDTTVGGSPTIWRSTAHQLGISGGGSDGACLCYSFFYTTPATGARTLRLQAGCDASGGVDVKSNAAGFNGDTTDVIPTLQAVVV